VPDYTLNLIDTRRSYVDFTYEVSRSLAACEAQSLSRRCPTQGVEAQTLANSTSQSKTTSRFGVPGHHKIDLPSAGRSVREQIEQVNRLDAARRNRGVGASRVSASAGDARGNRRADSGAERESGGASSRASVSTRGTTRIAAS